ncbi:uncharacterized protein RHIMIDRAFT_260758 [Rhizopus microsporus ATCC 52813]|uniref:Uncharacterized protein n=1 Tax=Rhizopus microsporus ATCC 52813 TaxID=1340429 RepID=A0A2G4SNQ8_RHIZD|nr:uncharacterized protein RHIMIDRAFT_260758 [Rhizopus microsporus ATCC 52813]PHZ10409.1 hypothetical protein RHIMIDRAFT_260758 [Rhizopus microsporus ATCC 52813]
MASDSPRLFNATSPSKKFATSLNTTGRSSHARQRMLSSKISAPLPINLPSLKSEHGGVNGNGHATEAPTSSPSISWEATHPDTRAWAAIPTSSIHPTTPSSAPFETDPKPKQDKPMEKHTTSEMGRLSWDEMVNEDMEEFSVDVIEFEDGAKFPVNDVSPETRFSEDYDRSYPPQLKSTLQEESPKKSTYEGRPFDRRQSSGSWNRRPSKPSAYSVLQKTKSPDQKDAMVAAVERAQRRHEEQEAAFEAARQRARQKAESLAAKPKEERTLADDEKDWSNYAEDMRASKSMPSRRPNGDTSWNDYTMRLHQSFVHKEEQKKTVSITAPPRRSSHGMPPEQVFQRRRSSSFVRHPSSPDHGSQEKPTVGLQRRGSSPSHSGAPLSGAFSALDKKVGPRHTFDHHSVHPKSPIEDTNQFSILDAEETEPNHQYDWLDVSEPEEVYDWSELAPKAEPPSMLSIGKSGLPLWLEKRGPTPHWTFNDPILPFDVRYPLYWTLNDPASSFDTRHPLSGGRGRGKPDTRAQRQVPVVTSILRKASEPTSTVAPSILPRKPMTVTNPSLEKDNQGDVKEEPHERTYKDKIMELFQKSTGSPILPKNLQAKTNLGGGINFMAIHHTEEKKDTQPSYPSSHVPVLVYRFPDQKGKKDNLTGIYLMPIKSTSSVHPLSAEFPLPRTMTA